MDGIDVVLEVGPGLGTLTSALFLYFQKVISVEFDPSLAAKLPGQFPGKDLTVIPADILDFDLSTLPEQYVVAGNIPYYITAPIIRKFLSATHKPAKLTLLVQKEVAERLAAAPGDYSILGLSAQIYARVTLGPVVPRDLFTPPPKVDSQVVILEPYATPLADESIMKLIKLGFSSPRKKLKNNLGLKDGILSSANLSEMARPSDLTIDDWKALAEYLHKR